MLRVNFSNPFAQSSIVSATGIWRKRHFSVSPTKLHQTLIVHTTRIHAQILHHMHDPKMQSKSTSARGEAKMLVKLNSVT